MIVERIGSWFEIMKDISNVCALYDANFMTYTYVVYVKPNGDLRVEFTIL